MKIKLKESQIINILKKEYERGWLMEEEDDALTRFIKGWADLRSAADGDEDAFGNFLFRQLGVDVDKFNPNFKVDNNTPLEDFETIDIWPVNNTKINSPYGPRNIGGKASRDHKGVDLYAKSGTPIYSPANGKVIAAKDSGSKCGGFIQIDHGKYETKYCHCRKWVVSKGQDVVKGQLIGYTGGGGRDPYKGNSMGAHLHYEVLVNGIHVNPANVHTSLS